MPNVLDVNVIFFTIWGYPMSYLEFFGTLFNLACVYLVAKNRISNWGVGIVGSALFVFLFFQIQLYADLVEQIYYIVTGFWGWYVWTKIGHENKALTGIRYNTWDTNFIWLVVIGLGTAALGWLVSNFHILMPQWFTEVASLPYLDAFTTVLSFVAQILLAKKRVESWYLWVLVDVIGIWLYMYKGVLLISGLYMVFLVLAIQGLITWTLIRRKEVTNE